MPRFAVTMASAMDQGHLLVLESVFVTRGRDGKVTFATVAVGIGIAKMKVFVLSARMVIVTLKLLGKHMIVETALVHSSSMAKRGLW